MITKKISFNSVLLLLFCLFFTKGYCSNFDKNNDFTNIDYSLFYFKDKKDINADNIISKTFNEFPDSKNFGIKNGTYWVKLVTKSSEYVINSIAYIPTHNIDLIEIYQLKNTTLKYLNSTGNSISRDELEIDFKYPAFKVKTNNTYYLKIKFPKEANFPLKIIVEKEFLNYILKKKTINSFYYGTCIIIILLNIFFFIKFRDKTYLYYLLLLTSLMVIFLLYDGSLIHLFRGNSFYYKLELIIHFSTEIWFLLFSIQFLNLKKKIPKTIKLFYLFPIGVVSFYLLFLITNNFTFIAIADSIGISLLPILWFYGFYYIKTVAYSKFYVLGYLLMIPFAVYFVIGYPLGFWEVHGDMLIVKIASWLDILVFTYAISYRMKSKLEDANKNVAALENYIKEIPKDANVKLAIDPHLVLLQKNELLKKPLTLREIDVLKLLNKGHANTIISEQLFISPNTLKSHIRNIYSKVDVKNRKDLKDKTTTLIG